MEQKGEIAPTDGKVAAMNGLAINSQSVEQMVGLVELLDQKLPYGIAKAAASAAVILITDCLQSMRDIAVDKKQNFSNRAQAATVASKLASALAELAQQISPSMSLQAAISRNKPPPQGPIIVARTVSLDSNGGR